MTTDRNDCTGSGDSLEPSSGDSPNPFDLMALMRFNQETERTRIASRLHDEVMQTVSAFRMKSYALDRRLRALDMQLADELSAALSILDEVALTVRDISEDMRPGALRLGIDAAIEFHAERFQRQSHIACIVDIETGRQPANESHATELLRIFQEALANVSLHAGATRVEVKLWRDGTNILLEIRDDGKPPHANESAQHVLGIVTMRERAIRAGGSLRIAKSRLEVRLPLND
jgi:signal transduction histidine kinase